MMGSLLKIFCGLTWLFASTSYGTQAELITYDWLIDCCKNNKPYMDHIPHFRRLFNTFKVRSFLECGCGYSTKYFIDHCERVVSIEFLTPGTTGQWMRDCKKLYRSCTNWAPIFYNADHRDLSFNDACAYQCSTHKDYALIDAGYLNSLGLLFKAQIDLGLQQNKEIDVAFVDPGVYIRGDMVKLLLAHQVPIVIAHDTATDIDPEAEEGLYGWFKVKTPIDYEKIYIPWGEGTTFWVRKNLENVIYSIKTYRDTIVRAQATKQLSYDQLTELADRFE